MYPFERKLLRRIQWLLCESLAEKWHQECNKFYDEDCPFCNDADNKREIGRSACAICLCPDSICGAHGCEGYLNTLNEKYIQLTPLVKNLHLLELKEMRKRFFRELMRINALFRESK